ncbi:histone-lysine N-methyltransferase PRDM9-like [Haliotis cracherodii]|uniref:histone-lysine N-methyltransferase PRDM9-like n=1 Tax=Haliotis cracherodii TaxID=6455 RepID=UPI0039E77A9C
MRYINCARTEEEQNLTAFQYNGHIYYKVYKKIGVGSELLVWYGHKFARDLGIERQLKFAEILTNDTYPCDSCDLGFSSVVFLWKHLKKLHGGKLTAQLRFIVNTQGVNIRDFVGVLESQEQNRDTQHVDIRDSDTNKDRSNGGEGASTESDDAQTVGHHQGGNRHKCHKCGKEFTTKSKLHAHRCLRIVKPFSCEECGKTFKQLSERQTHMSVHTAVEPYSCKFRECGKTFALLGTLKQHILRNHSGEKPFKCKECEKAFKYLSRLKTHMMTHNRGRPYSCSECGKTFARVQNMNSHKMVHSRIPHSCEECGKTFRQFGQLKVHMVSHSGVRPYTCEECGKTYKRSQQLLVHMVSHSDVKPFPCFLCEKAYTRSNYLKKHLVTHE